MCCSATCIDKGLTPNGSADACRDKACEVTVPERYGAGKWELDACFVELRAMLHEPEFGMHAPNCGFRIFAKLDAVGVLRSVRDTHSGEECNVWTPTGLCLLLASVVGPESVLLQRGFPLSREKVGGRRLFAVPAAPADSLHPTFSRAKTLVIASLKQHRLGPMQILRAFG